jgi:ribosomal protein L11 methyltransferase
VRTWPALDLTAARTAVPVDDPEGLLAALLDDHPVFAIVERPEHSRGRLAWRVFFHSPEGRAGAAAALAAEPRWQAVTCAAVDVPDEEWAQRSQAALTAIRIGRLIVTPPWDRDRAEADAAALRAGGGTAIVVTIEPSMGFGTGHHESTRLCLLALQRVAPEGRSVLDIGTGSGVLAIAAARLGCRRALAIDDDPDALEAAAGNVALNGVGACVEIRRVDLAGAALSPADVVLANLTGALLRRQAARVTACVAPGGTLILSGFTAEERLAVAAAFEPLAVEHADVEAGWMALTLRAPATTAWSPTS